MMPYELLEQSIQGERVINVGSIALVASATKKNVWYYVTEHTCGCEGFKYRGECRHIKLITDNGLLRGAYGNRHVYIIRHTTLDGKQSDYHYVTDDLQYVCKIAGEHLASGLGGAVQVEVIERKEVETIYHVLLKVNPTISTN